jgi:hypothetical protein
VAFGFHSFIISLAVYLPKYGFGFLAIIWLIISMYLLFFGIEGIIYSVRNGGKSYKVILIISSIFVGAFLFISILMMNPCVLLLADSKCI